MSPLNTLPSATLVPGKKVLVTVDKWFYAPDGRQYRAIFGTVHALRKAEEIIGTTPTERSTNWYLTIGNMTVAGCQIHFVTDTDICHPGPALDWHSSSEHGKKEFDRPSAIYFADAQGRAEMPQSVAQ